MLSTLRIQVGLSPTRTSASARSSQRTAHLPLVNDSRSAKAHDHPVSPTSNRYNSGSVDGFQDVGPADMRTPNRRYKNLNAVENHTLAPHAQGVLSCQYSHGGYIQVRPLLSSDNPTHRQNFAHMRDYMYSVFARARAAPYADDRGLRYHRLDSENTRPVLR